MKYEKNKAAYQDDSWFERERNVLDVRNWNGDLIGQKFENRSFTNNTCLT